MADLKAIIHEKDSINKRLAESVRVLSIRPPDVVSKLPVQPGASARSVVKTSTGPKPLVSINWPKTENWFWRGLAGYLVFETVRAAIRNR
ncbi:hypothetical protein [Spirosoma oryzicola]|uniref:hypothetical protein n=1 Tax=Spirosoma oryzicola TaxID=2898794 RepID=UPI001E44302A|nr:hypothetical protein [Spirosoma oryzicola]UHG91778.1 hypothetical protein LQ777_02500 [Spirosoma oryzicola]